MSTELDEILKRHLYRGQEETYLEYKGDIPWTTKPKQLEIEKTVYALANEQSGGVIIIGIDDDGKRVGLTDVNYASYSHDRIHQHLIGKTNQAISCKVEKVEYLDEEDSILKKFIFIQVKECVEFPLIYTGRMELANESSPPYPGNIVLRPGALYIRNKLNIGNKEIETTEEWEELIERTYRKYHRKSLRRYEAVALDSSNPFDEELSI